MGMTPVAITPRFHPPRHFENGAEWLHALGDVPMDRIIFDPWPGTATEADLLLLVERDKRLCELIDGTLVEKPVGLHEAIVASNLMIELGPHAKRLRGIISGADSTLGMRSGRVRLPDVVWFTRERLPGGVVPAEAVPSIAPDLAVEVLSENNTPAEMGQKLREYFDSGTRLAWIIDPHRRTVAIYDQAGEPTRILDEKSVLDGEPVVPGFAMPVSELFLNLPQGAT